MISLQCNRDLLPTPIGVVPIPKGKLTDPHNKKEKGFVPVPAPHREIMWVHLTLSKVRNGRLSLIESLRGKPKQCNLALHQHEVALIIKRDTYVASSNINLNQGRISASNTYLGSD